jgi:hypothetical protein
MVEAATRGIVDFSQAKFFDPAWRRRVKYLIGGLQDLNRREELKSDHSYYLSLLNIPNLKPDLFGDVVKLLERTRTRLEAAWRPWVTPESNEAQKTAEAKRLQTLWERQWGKLDDPETQRKIAATAAAMRKQAADNASEISADDILTNRKKRADARERTGQPRRRRNDALGRNLRLSRAGR